MKKLLLVLLVIAFVAVISFAMAQLTNPDKVTDSRSAHSMLSPSEIKWVPAPPKLPSGAQFAVLHGDRSKPGESYTFRAKLPDGYSVAPHWHSTDENITVIQGTMRLGMGDKFDAAKLRDLPAGSYVLLSKGEPHFNLYKGETIIQLHGLGPYDIHYVNPADDPTTK